MTGVPPQAGSGHSVSDPSPDGLGHMASVPNADDLPAGQYGDWWLWDSPRGGLWMVTHDNCNGSFASCARLGCLRDVEWEIAASAIEARRAETHSGSVADESAVGEAETPNHHRDSRHD